MLDVTASIVLYRNDYETLKKTVDSFLASPRASKLILVDNSPTDVLRDLGNRDRCVYIFNNGNVGFGKAHNIAIQSVLDDTRYHLVLNPDVVFDNQVVGRLADYLDQHPEVGLIMPRVLSFESTMQFLARRLPSPADLIIRRLGFSWLVKLFEKKLYKYEMRDKNYNKIINAPSLSGCFMLFSAEALRKVGLFDDRFFMYLEDVDISRRVHRAFQTLYFPDVHIFHGHARASYHLNKLLFIHITSAIRYFNKWGWIFDRERSEFNNESRPETIRPVWNTTSPESNNGK